jgi:hypothetical protein
MLAPDGTSGDIPQDRVQDALRAGFKPAVEMVSPDGKMGYIPQDKQQDALNAGFKMPDLSANPNHEGLYQMRGPDGKTVGIPYSNVTAAAKQGNVFASDAEHDRYLKDFGYAVAQKDPYLQSLKPSLGGTASAVGGELKNVVSGLKQVFAPPQGVIETLEGPTLPLVRMGKGYVESAKTGLGQAVDYAKNGEPTRATITAVGALNPLSSGPTAALNAAANQGAPTDQIIGQGLTDAGLLAAPEVGAAIAKSGLPSAFLSRTGEALYRNALKPPTTVPTAINAARIQTALDNSLPVSPAGVEKLGNLIDDFNNKIAGEIAKDPNRPIDPNVVARRAQDVVPTFTSQVNAGGDLAAIEASRQQFLAEQGAQPGKAAIPPQPTGVLDAQGRPIMTAGAPAQPPTPAPPMSAADAQAMKQGTYNVLRKKYGEQGSASVEAQKALARGLKEEIATQFPEIDNLNAAESKLLDLGPVLERAVNRVSNNHTIGIGGPILGTALKASTGSTGVAAVGGALKSIIDIPAVKSQIAIALSKGAKIPYPQALARVSAYQASLGSAVAASQAYPSGDSSNQPAQ